LRIGYYHPTPPTIYYEKVYNYSLIILWRAMMERSRPELDSWLQIADEVLRDEEVVLESLKMAVERGFMTQTELEENIEAYHKARLADIPQHLICPQIDGSDL
jgi:hypothetical protein